MSALHRAAGPGRCRGRDNQVAEPNGRERTHREAAQAEATALRKAKAQPRHEAGGRAADHRRPAILSGRHPRRRGGAGQGREEGGAAAAGLRLRHLLLGGHVGTPSPRAPAPPGTPRSRRRPRRPRAVHGAPRGRARAPPRHRRGCPRRHRRRWPARQ
ncbi:hypothetical protein ACP70R_011670 [Stipagrostis hirtigluma subsp. patula]